MKNLSPDPLLKHGKSLWESCVLIAGVRLGVFKALRGRQLTAAGLARKCRSSLRGMKALADALAAHSYLGFRKGRYLNTPLSRRYRFKFMDVPRSPSGLLTAVRTAAGAESSRARRAAGR